MIGKLMSREEVNAALVLALSGAIMAMVTNGPGPVSLGRMVSGALSNPVPKGKTGTRGRASDPDQDRQIAA